jgi:SAM-dependent methyltransferase
MTVYTPRFFARFAEGSLRSARAVLPALFEYVPVRSVVDIGCGTGGWLCAARENGCDYVIGVDGGYVEQQALHIDPSEFVSCSLEGDFGPAIASRGKDRFDLALCLEVAEHLPKHTASLLIERLTALSDLVLFSAAVPFQGGTNHVNEQWPEYWALLFKQRGYGCFDLLRQRFWMDPRVEWWYAQNLLVFARLGSDIVRRLPPQAVPRSLARIHPCNYLCRATESGTAFFAEWRAVSRRCHDNLL